MKVKLDSGEIFEDRYGKYQEQLSFIYDENYDWEYTADDEQKKAMNLPMNHRYTFLYGDYFISKKGKPCFRIKPKEQARHVLVSEDWGGCFNDNRGRSLPEGLMNIRRCSHGGGLGVDYALYEKGFSNKVSLDDL